MGLKQRLLQGQTTLSAGSFPGDIPINDPQSGFVQENSPNNTYEDETIGQPDNGSVLATTLSNTSLDNTQPLFDTATLPPSTTTDYPSLVSGEFNGAPSQYTPIYNANNTYLDSISDINNTPQTNTLGQTGLDNTNSNAVPTTITPNSVSYPNNYPELVSGEFSSAPSQYSSPYNSTNTYLDNVSIEDQNSPQLSTLEQTGLDNTNANAEPTTVVPNNISYPNNYPVLTSGEFNGAPSQYVSIYNSNNTYLNSITDINSTPQVNTLGQTGLDNTNTNADPTTVVPNNISYPNNYPPLVSGEFNGAPSQYVSPYNPNNTYLNSIITTDTSPQIDTLGQTGLDVEDTNAVETTTTPNNITSPNNYGNLPNSPSVQLGEYGGAPSQYTSPYTPNNSYLSQIDSPDFNSVQVAAITGSGLDTDLVNAAETTFIVPLPDTITTYPADNVTHNTLTSGTDSAPKYYNQIWSNQNSYWNFFQDSPESFNPNTENKFQGNYDALGRLLNRLSNRIRR